MASPRKQRIQPREPAGAVRAEAARLLCAVIHHGVSLSERMAPALEQVAARDRALLQEMVYGALRWHLRLEAFARLLLQRPLKTRDRDVHCLLLIGLYQLLYMRLPDYASISATVESVRAGLGKSWAAGLLNGVLRNCQRQGDALAERVDRDEQARHAHPEWLLRMLQRDWPADWQLIVAADNARPPMTLRVNVLRCDRETYLARLTSAHIGARPALHAPAGLVLDEPMDVSRLPGFAEGDVSVQDGAAQLAAELLQVPAGGQVLDACAAPGGKTAHLLERYPEAVVTALDADQRRSAKVTETLQRLHLQARVRCGDGAQPEQWSDGQRFERILLDAPCSATGVIRRHPDIKTLRRASDIESLAARQAALLDGVWPLLDPGGILLYSTCSVLTRENAAQVGAFIARRSDVEELPIEADWGRPQAHGRQILPGDDDMDGFYFALLRKKAPAGG